MTQQSNQSLRQLVERDKHGDPPANASVAPSIDNNTELDRINESIDAPISEAVHEAEDTFLTA